MNCAQVYKILVMHRQLCTAVHKIVGPVHKPVQFDVHSVDEFAHLCMNILKLEIVHSSHTGGVSKFDSNFK